MPQIFRIGSYIIYFWPNEKNPVEHVCFFAFLQGSDILFLIHAKASKTLWPF